MSEMENLNLRYRIEVVGSIHTAVRRDCRAYESPHWDIYSIIREGIHLNLLSNEMGDLL